jgi:hypothetical protein
MAHLKAFCPSPYTPDLTSRKEMGTLVCCLIDVLTTCTISANELAVTLGFEVVGC